MSHTEPGTECVPVHERFLHERAVLAENLNAIVDAIPHRRSRRSTDRAVYGVELLGGRTLGVYTDIGSSLGLFPYAPQCRLYFPVATSRRDHAAVPVAVADVELIGRIPPQLGGLPEILDVVAAVVHAVLADLKDLFSGGGRSRGKLRVLVAVAAEPHVAQAIDLMP